MIKAELIDWMGSDEGIVNAARVSYDKNAGSYTEEQNTNLLRYLEKHGHWSPFTHTCLQFRITCPIYVERQLFKTQVGVSVNSISGRYVDFSDTYTPITEWRKQSTSSKQGSEGLVENQLACQHIEQRVIDTCKDAYKMLLELGVSKEQARTILPLNLNTTFIWTGNIGSFIRLFKQRVKPDAQKETGEVVKLMFKSLIEKTRDFDKTLNILIHE